MIYLHEETADQSLPDVEVIIFAGEFGGNLFQIESIHYFL